MDIMEALELVTRSIKAWTSSRLDDIDAQIADILYKEIQITSFYVKDSAYVKNGVAELGATFDLVEISWAFNKTPTAQTIDGVSVDVSARSYTSNNPHKTFVLRATDERGKVASKSISISFLNGVYFGAIDVGATIDSELICGLSRTLQSSKTKTFTTNAGNGQHIIYALPARYGAPSFNVGGFDGGFHKEETIIFENASGYKEPYDVWLSDNVGLGATTVKVT